MEVRKEPVALKSFDEWRKTEKGTPTWRCGNALTVLPLASMHDSTHSCKHCGQSLETGRSTPLGQWRTLTTSADPCLRPACRNRRALFAMAIVAAMAVAAISVSPLGGVLAQRFDAAFVYVSKVPLKRLFPDALMCSMLWQCRSAGHTLCS